jgi:hypothetical protein
MNGSFREEKYTIGGREFVKRYASGGALSVYGGRICFMLS